MYLLILIWLVCNLSFLNYFYSLIGILLKFPTLSNILDLDLQRPDKNEGAIGKAD